MKLYNFFCVLMASTLLIYSENQSSHNPIPTINITVTTANNADLQQSNNFNQTSKNQSCQQNYAIEKSAHAHAQETLYAFLDKQFQQAQSTSASLLNWSICNKIKSLGLSIIFIYSCIIAHIHKNYSIINDPASWSNWHHGQSLQDLFATPQSALESDLLFAIQTKYVHPINPTDFIYSIVQSSLSLKEEIKIVEQQIWYYQWLAKCQILPLFFLTTQELEDLKEQHRKLLFMQHIFASWCAHYKIDKNN